MAKWLITYDDGEDIREETVTGKLSLDGTWVFAMDTQRGPNSITFAVPAYRVIEVRAQEG